MSKSGMVGPYLYRSRDPFLLPSIERTEADAALFDTEQNGAAIIVSGYCFKDSKELSILTDASQFPLRVEQEKEDVTVAVSPRPKLPYQSWLQMHGLPCHGK